MAEPANLPANLKVLREAVLEMAGRGIRAGRCGKRLPCVTLDIDSAPIEVPGHQPKAGTSRRPSGTATTTPGSILR